MTWRDGLSLHDLQFLQGTTRGGNPKNTLPVVGEMFVDASRGCLHAAQIKHLSPPRCVLSFITVTCALPFTKLKVCVETPFLNVRGR